VTVGPLADPGRPVVLDRVSTPRGELVLRRSGDQLEIVSNGTFLMDTRGGTSERLLVSAAVARLDVEAHPELRPAHVLLGGLGVGFSLLAALADPLVQHVTVVEREPAVVGWHDGPLQPWSAGALDDPRVELVVADVREWLRATDDSYAAICLDVDNGPTWTVTDDNAQLYGSAGLTELGRHLLPAGVLAVWSAAAAPSFEARLMEQFETVEAVAAPVPRGEPDLIYVAHTLTHPPTQGA
jgi:spermidine synthase